MEKNFFNENDSADNRVIKPVLALTGGEPLIREDFFDLLEVISKHSNVIETIILSNGTLITKEIAEKLKQFNIARVQISIDGDEQMHDEIRGKGNFRKALRGIENLTDAGVVATASFTAHKQNFRRFPRVADILKNSGVLWLWSDRIIPEGSGKDLLALNKEETKEYVQILEDTRKKIAAENLPFIIKNARALQFLAKESADTAYSCQAAKQAFTLMHDGTVYPCRRMPIYAGNVYEQSLKEIYCNSDIFKELRAYKEPPKGCEKCEYVTKCQGGLRCQTYAIHGDYKIADPGCWLT